MTRLNILIVDDSETMRGILRHYLTLVGHIIYEANDGLEALGQLKVEKIDLVITDINMPNMDGYEFIKNIRASSINSFIPILAVTTQTAPQQIQKGREVGASGWLAKPFHEDAVISAINRLAC
ncbi:MAG: response regulator [Gammaproteobacteria bacterium]|nr:response regulator [Gammaproteobacteria bacterium]